MNKSGRCVKALSEVLIQVNALEKMREFCSPYFPDPDGNLLEFACYDPGLGEAQED